MTEKTEKKTLGDHTEESADAIEKAIRWVCAQSTDGKTCPLCGWVVPYDDKDKATKLFDHMRVRHLYRSIAAYEHGTLDVPRKDVDGDPVAEAGLEVVDELSEYDPLHIPVALKRQVEADGSRVRLVSPSNVTRYKDMGFEFVEPTDDTKSEDGKLKVNELIAMKVPARWLERREVLKRKRSGDVIATRKEDFERRMDEHARKVYDHAVHKGIPADQARNMARAIERGLATGNITRR